MSYDNNYNLVQEQEKKRKQKEEAKKKLEAEKVWKKLLLSSHSYRRKALVVKWRICIHIFYFPCFFRLQKKPKPEFLHGKCLNTRQTSILNLMSRSETLSKSFIFFSNLGIAFWWAEVFLRCLAFRRYTAWDVAEFVGKVSVFQKFFFFIQSNTLQVFLCRLIIQKKNGVVVFLFKITVSLPNVFQHFIILF